MIILPFSLSDSSGLSQLNLQSDSHEGIRASDDHNEIVSGCIGKKVRLVKLKCFHYVISIYSHNYLKCYLFYAWVFCIVSVFQSTFPFFRIIECYPVFCYLVNFLLLDHNSTPDLLFSYTVWSISFHRTIKYHHILYSTILYHLIFYYLSSSIIMSCIVMYSVVLFCMI